MKKGGVLNSELSHIIATMGHTDALVVADSGLPIPGSVRKVDLALVKGVPGFLETVEAILQELQVERVIVAREMSERSPQLYEQVRSLFAAVPIEEIPHEEFKAKVSGAKAVVRTGECTPYANIILISGVIF
ncbi:MAG: D-ribose pyranase [Armatimonadota bacterium]|nr:D-ribose pyranase [Armatimonadota bacterium]